MEAIATTPELKAQIERRADELRHAYETAQWKQTDRMFAVLLAIQWFAGIAMAIWLSPYAWEGLEKHIHPHVWGAIFVGGIVAAGPIFLAIVRPGETLTRYVISAAQALHSALLIHLSGGRIETHFHVFGSLAFISFYRDWRALVPATIVVALDHAVRGIFWPESVFGVITASPWRWMEHAGWVVFEDIILVWACVRGARELAVLASRQAELEASNQRVEAEVARQTARLESVSQELLGTARRAGMAEIATGVLHNVGNVLNSVNVSASVAMRTIQGSEVSSLVKVRDILKTNQDNLAAYISQDARGKHLPTFLIELADCLAKENANLLEELKTVSTGLDHIKGIVSAQQKHAKEGALRERVSPAEIFEQAIEMDLGSTAVDRVEIVRNFQPIASVAMDKHKVLQILINLLSNAKKAVASNNGQGRRIELTIKTSDTAEGQRLQFEVKDNGVGIDPENLAKIFSHGFTTRAEGHGFGLHSAANAAREMGGNLSVASEGAGRGAVFTLDFPLSDLSTAEQMIQRKK